MQMSLSLSHLLLTTWQYYLLWGAGSQWTQSTVDHEVETTDSKVVHADNELEEDCRAISPSVCMISACQASNPLLASWQALGYKEGNNEMAPDRWRPRWVLGEMAL